MEPGSVESIALVIAAIANVPVFLIAVFLLQTKFRPELQEDAYYSSYLDRKTNQAVTVSKSESQLIHISNRLSALEKQAPDEQHNSDILRGLKIGINSSIDDTDRLSDLLAQHNIKYVSHFGTGEAPLERAVAISPDVPQVIIDKVLDIARETGFTHFGYLTKGPFEDSEEDVLFGSYGESEYSLT